MWTIVACRHRLYRKTRIDVRLRTHGCVGVIVQWNRHELSKIRVIIAKLDDSPQTLISILNIYKFREKWSNYFFVNAKMIREMKEGRERWKHAQFRYSWTMHAYSRLHLCVVSLLLALQEASTSLSNHSMRWSWFKEFTKIDDSIQPSQTLYHLFQSQFCDVGSCYWIYFLKKLDNNRGHKPHKLLFDTSKIDSKIQHSFHELCKHLKPLHRFLLSQLSNKTRSIIKLH